MRPARDFHGSRNTTPVEVARNLKMCMGMRFPMGPGIPWESHGNGNKTQNWEWEWEGMGNGNYLHSHGNLFPNVLCCDEFIKLLVLYLPDVSAYCAELITLNVPSA